MALKRATNRYCAAQPAFNRWWLTLPSGLSEGLPVGLQLIGPQFGENALFRIGHALEHAIGFDTVPERYRP